MPIFLQIEAKYKLLKVLNWKNLTDTKTFWFEIHSFSGDKDLNLKGEGPLKMLSSGVLRMLTVPLFCSEVDSIFAQLYTTRSECSRMKPDLVEAVCYVKYGLKAFKEFPSHYKIPVEALTDA